MIQSAPPISPPVSPSGPSQALVEVLLHEIANPLQAAQSTLRLWHGDTALTPVHQERLERLESSFDRVAQVLRIVQTVKDAALRAPVPVAADKLLNDLAGECRAAGVELALVSELPRELLRLHGGTVAILIAAWARSVSTAPAMAKVRFEQLDNDWLMLVNTRIGAANAVRFELTATSAAGFAAAIGEFMRAADGLAYIGEDDDGAFELVLHVSTWLRQERVR